MPVIQLPDEPVDGVLEVSLHIVFPMDHIETVRRRNGKDYQAADLGMPYGTINFTIDQSLPDRFLRAKGMISTNADITFLEDKPYHWSSGGMITAGKELGRAYLPAILRKDLGERSEEVLEIALSLVDDMLEYGTFCMGEPLFRKCMALEEGELKIGDTVCFRDRHISRGKQGEILTPMPKLFGYTRSAAGFAQIEERYRKTGERKGPKYWVGTLIGYSISGDVYLHPDGVTTFTSFVSLDMPALLTTERLQRLTPHLENSELSSHQILKLWEIAEEQTTREKQIRDKRER